MFLLPLLGTIGTSLGIGGAAAGAGMAGLIGASSVAGLADAGIATVAATAGTAATAGFGLADVFSIGSTLFSAIGSISAGNQQQEMAEYNAQVLRNQASASDLAGQAEAGRIHDINRRKVAQGMNAYAASGVDVSLGSPVDVMSDIAAQGALDEQIARWRGKVGAQGYQNQATAMQYQGDMAASAGYAKAGGTLLSGFGRVLSPSAPGYGGGSGYF